MATQYSTIATNFRGKTTKNPVTEMEGNLKMISETISVAAADNDGEVYMIAPVRSNWSIKHIWVYNDAITSGTDYDIGLYTTASTPVAYDVDCYADGISMASARTSSPIDAVASTRNITGVNNRVFEDAASPVTSDPATWYWLGITANTVGSAQGDITVIIEYVGD
jgi:hypothetical protein